MAEYKAYIDAGHDNDDPGAVGYVIERDVNLVMALACRDHLVKNGVTVKMSRETNKVDTTITKMANEANAWDADLVVSIHNNAGKGDGFEAYYHIGGGKGKTLASNIEAEVKKLGQNSRGIKTKTNADGTDYYGIIRLTNAPAIICEGAFVDNATDVKIIDTEAEQKAFGVAYARGILKTLGITEKVEVKPATSVVKTTKTALKRGDKIVLNKAKLYATSTSKEVASLVSGTFYMWDDKVINGRRRITNSKSRVGVSNQVSGYIDESLAVKVTKETSNGFLVKVTADVLNIRTAPGVNHSIVGEIRDQGIYTIVEVSGDWGKLKSGAGWIYLGYTERV